MNWVLRHVLRAALEQEAGEDVPQEIAAAHGAFLEWAGLALAAEVSNLELLDALGEGVDTLAARALAELN